MRTGVLRNVIWCLGHVICVPGGTGVLAMFVPVTTGEASVLLVSWLIRHPNGPFFPLQSSCAAVGCLPGTAGFLRCGELLRDVPAAPRMCTHVHRELEPEWGVEWGPNSQGTSCVQSRQGLW